MRALRDLAALALGGEQTICKCCGDLARVMGGVDFNKCCEEPAGVVLPVSGVEVPYFRCGRCGFVFTRFFDVWKPEDFLDHVYNEGYLQVDPDYAGARAEGAAQVILKNFGEHREKLRFLDWGGGSGLLAERLRENGFLCADNHDPFDEKGMGAPSGTYDLLSCFEVLEHVVDPKQTIRAISKYVKADGLVFMSTAILGSSFENHGLNWSYISPRNGHVSIYSMHALYGIWAAEGFTVTSMSENFHLAWKNRPWFFAS